MPLTQYIEALKSGEDFMLRRLFHYATTSEYTRYTSTKEEEWRMTLREPAKTLLAYLHDHEEPEMIHVDEIFEENPAAAFGILEAQRHRRRGIKFDMFLAMAKYVRQCFVDLIYEISLSGEETKQALAITHRFFDKFELGFSSEWVKQSEKELIEELQQTNRILTNEKNRYLTIFQSMAEPVFVVDKNMQLVVVNKAFEKMTGVSNQGFLGKVCTEVLSNPLCPACPLKKVMKESSSFADTEINLSINGADKTFLMSGGFLDDISGKYPGGVAILQDITERKRTEEALRHSREDLNRAQAVVQVGSWRLDVRRNVLTWSDENHRIFGLRGTPLTYETFLGTVHPDDRQYVDTQWQEGLRGAPYDIEHRLVVDGQEKWVREKAYLEFDQAGELLGGFGITQDITERKLAENALRESEERFRLLVENAPEAIYIQAQGQFVYVNKVAVRLFGATSPDQLLGQPILCRIHPDYQEIVRERIRLINEERREIPLIEQRCLKLDGTSFYSEVSAVPFLYEGRKGALVFCRDITERKRAEEMFRKIKDLLNATGRMAKVGGWEFDIKTMELVWTEEVYLIHEVDMPYEPTVSKAIDFYAPQSRPIIEQALQRAIEHGEPFNLELEFITAKNNHKWVHAIGKADQEHFKVFGTFQDISERKQLEEALQRSHDELEEQVRERTAELVRTNEEVRRISGKLLSAHEEERKRIAGEIHDILGSGLSAIKFKIEDVMQKIGNSSNVVSEYLNPVVPLIQETIAECRRIQMNLRPPMLDDLGLLPTLSWFFRRFQTIYPNISVEQAMDIEEEDVPGPLKIVIFRVIQEAVNNAAKYSQADLVGQSLRKQDGQMELVIRDNGRGFDLEEAFSPERARKGLGLTSMKERVELSGGFFSIESAKGEGTVIRAVWSI